MYRHNNVSAWYLAVYNFVYSLVPVHQATDVELAIRLAETPPSVIGRGSSTLKCIFNTFKPFALRTAKTLRSFGCSECNRVKMHVKYPKLNKTSVGSLILGCFMLFSNLTLRSG